MFARYTSPNPPRPIMASELKLCVAVLISSKLYIMISESIFPEPEFTVHKQTVGHSFTLFSHILTVYCGEKNMILKYTTSLPLAKLILKLGTRKMADCSIRPIEYKTLLSDYICTLGVSLVLQEF